MKIQIKNLECGTRFFHGGDEYLKINLLSYMLETNVVNKGDCFAVNLKTFNLAHFVGHAEVEPCNNTTMFENLKSMNIDEFAEWFEENCIHNDDPCIKWWDKTYCKNCEPIVKDGYECAYCELNNKCKFFNDMNNIPSIKETIKIWLESEVK